MTFDPVMTCLRRTPIHERAALRMKSMATTGERRRQDKEAGKHKREWRGGLLKRYTRELIRENMRTVYVQIT